MLEALVDEALSNETDATMKEWLASQRNSNIFSYYGNGNVENISRPSKINFDIFKETSIKFSKKEACTDKSCFNEELTYAA